MEDITKTIAKESKSSFYYAFSLLPEHKRRAMNAVYAFCRQTDDIVDELEEPDDIKFAKLHKWRVELEKALDGSSEFPLLNVLSQYIKRFNIPLVPFFELIKGMEMDLNVKRYLDFDDLLVYCYRVASTVGLICIEIFGYKNKSAIEYAVNLGYALQLTNIIRDVNSDAQRGRIYIPLNDMKKFDYGEEDLFAGKYNKNFINLMTYEAERARGYFDKANQALHIEDKPSMFAARAMQHIYYKLLKRLEVKRFDVFNNNIKVSKFEKAGIALGVWAKYSLVY